MGNKKGGILSTKEKVEHFSTLATCFFYMETKDLRSCNRANNSLGQKGIYVIADAATKSNGCQNYRKDVQAKMEQVYDHLRKAGKDPQTDWTKLADDVVNLRYHVRMRFADDIPEEIVSWLHDDRISTEKDPDGTLWISAHEFLFYSCEKMVDCGLFSAIQDVKFNCERSGWVATNAFEGGDEVLRAPSRGMLRAIVFLIMMSAGNVVFKKDGIDCTLDQKSFLRMCNLIELEQVSRDQYVFGPIDPSAYPLASTSISSGLYHVIDLADGCKVNFIDIRGQEPTMLILMTGHLKGKMERRNRKVSIVMHESLDASVKVFLKEAFNRDSVFEYSRVEELPNLRLYESKIHITAKDIKNFAKLYWPLFYNNARESVPMDEAVIEMVDDYIKR